MQGGTCFREPVEVVCAEHAEDVLPALRRVEEAVGTGLHAAGFVAYEASPGIAPELVTHPPNALPLVWFGLYAEARSLAETEETGTVPSRSGTRSLGTVPISPSAYTVGTWAPEMAEDDYLAAVERIRELIAAGDTYQVNFTFPMRASFDGDAEAWFHDLCRAQHTDYAAYIDTGRFQIVSVSPELFFRVDGDRIAVRPMKGTRPRGRWPEEDRALADELAASEKERAENVMIVDLLRNDLGRVSTTGSVHVDSLFDIERYETVWQMTSTISARTAASLTRVFSALFPSGSVTRRSQDPHHADHSRTRGGAARRLLRRGWVVGAGRKGPV